MIIEYGIHAVLKEKHKINLPVHSQLLIVNNQNKSTLYRVISFSVLP